MGHIYPVLLYDHTIDFGNRSCFSPALVQQHSPICKPLRTRRNNPHNYMVAQVNKNVKTIELSNTSESKYSFYKTHWPQLMNTMPDAILFWLLQLANIEEAVLVGGRRKYQIETWRTFFELCPFS